PALPSPPSRSCRHARPPRAIAAGARQSSARHRHARRQAPKSPTRALFRPVIPAALTCLPTLISLYPFTCPGGVRFSVSSALAIEAKGLFKSFDDKPAVRGIDIAVPEGSIYGILGPNGARKA